MFYFILVYGNFLFSQEKYGFNFGKDWEWGEMMYGGYPITIEALRTLEQMRDDIPIQQGRYLFRNLIRLDNVNQIKLIADVALLDSPQKQQRWKEKLDSAFSNIDLPNNLSGLIASASLLVDIYKTATIKATDFKGETFISKPSNDIRYKGINVNLRTSKARTTLNILENATTTSLSTDDIFSLFENVPDSVLKNNFEYFIKAITDEPYINIYKLINPESFCNLGGAFIYRKEIKRCLDKLDENIDYVSQEIQLSLEEFLPNKILFNPVVDFCVGFPDDNLLKFNLEAYGDNFTNIKNNLSRNLFVKSKECFYFDVYKYLFSGKDSLFLKIMSEVYNGGMLNYAVPVKVDNRPLNLLEKDFNHFRRTAGEIRKGSSPGFIDTLIENGLKETKLFYTMGNQMCTSIEKILGKNVTRNTIITGPLFFFKYYIESFRDDPGNIWEVFRFPKYFNDKIDSLSLIFPERMILDASEVKMLIKGNRSLDSLTIKKIIIESKDSLIKKYKLNKDFKNSVFFSELLFSELLFSENFYEESTELFLKTLKSLPNKGYSSKTFGIALFNKEAYSQSLQMFDEYVKYSYNSTDALILRAKTYIKLDNWDNAKIDLQNILNLEPWNEEAKKLLELTQ